MKIRKSGFATPSIFILCYCMGRSMMISPNSNYRRRKEVLRDYKRAYWIWEE